MNLLLLILVSILALGSRLHRITWPDIVVWDETHFGKHVRWYLRGEFFFDVHPPLGKLAFAALAWLRGHDADEETFEKPGSAYNGTLHIELRVLSAVCGALIVPVSVLSAAELGGSTLGLLLTGTAFLLDPALITVSQYILLDSPALLAQALLLLSALRLRRGGSLVPVGLGLFAVCGVKLSGALSAVFVGLSVLRRRGPTPGLFLSLILLPAGLYAALFRLHLAVLWRSGAGDGFLSGPFQASLEGSRLRHSLHGESLHPGSSTLTLKATETGAGYLHSHSQHYPEEIVEGVQQVTGYSHRDRNNRWVVESVEESAVDVRLRHAETGQYLAVFDVDAPMAGRRRLVGAAPVAPDQEFYSTVWSFLVARAGVPPTQVRTHQTHFELQNARFACHLVLSRTALPDWGFEQHGVSCSRAAATTWVVEENAGPAGAAKVNLTDLVPSFPAKLLELHRLMLTANAQMRPKEGEIFSGRVAKVRLRGNHFLWRLNIVVVCAFPFIYTLLAGRRKRLRAFGQRLPLDLEMLWDRLEIGGWLWFGSMFHFLPYLAMSRMLYFHHYLPVLLFNHLLTAHCIDCVFVFLNMRMQVSLFVCYFACSLYSFVEQMPLCYGKPIK